MFSLPCVYAITESECPHAKSPLESHVLIANAALAAGVKAIQFRDKTADGKRLLSPEKAHEACVKIRTMCMKKNAAFIINDDLELALDLGVGVHLGQSELKKQSISKAREILPENTVIGVSANGLREAKKAALQDVEYIGLGPVFHTRSKNDTSTPLGIAALNVVRYVFNENGLLAPIIAIGGITDYNAEAVMRSGADGVAVISAISRASDMEQAAKKLVGLINRF